MITIKSLSKSYGHKVILNEIDLNLTEGSVTGIIGKNGAGKSTLFKCISGLESCDGTIQSPFNKIKDHIGFLPTIPYFFSKLTGREYLQLLANARSIPIRNIDLKNVFDLPLDEYAEIYSTGMKKKLALTGILIQANDILILDEPFNGVDLESNFLILQIIKKLQQKNKTVLISSHILGTLKDICDCIYLLDTLTLSQPYLKNDFEKLENIFTQRLISDKIDHLLSD